MPVLGWSQWAVVRLMEFADEAPVEVNLPDAFAFGPQRYLITSQRLADETHTAAPINFSFLLHPAQQPVSWMTQWQDAAIRTATRSPALRGDTLLQSFMRAFVIVMTQPTLGAPLLRGRSGGWWTDCFSFEFAMPLFVRAIIRRSSAPAVFHLNTQTDPPSAQPREMRRPGAAERPTLVTMNRVRQSVAPEQTHELAAHSRFGAIRQDAHAQAITTVEIAHGQRFTTRTISGAKVTFEIHRPHLVGPAGRPKRWPSAYWPPRAARAWMAQMQPLQNAANGTDCRHMRSRKLPAQPGVKFFRAPTRKAVAGLTDAFDPMRTQLERTTTWPAGLLHQSSATASPVSAPPLVTGLPGDPIRTTNGGKCRASLRNLLAKLNLLFRRKMIACGHTPHSMCQRCPESKVSAMSWVHA